MKTMKKITAMLCAAVLLAGASACGESSQIESDTAESSAAEQSSAAESSDAAEESSAAPALVGADPVPYDESWEPADPSLGLPALNLGMTTEEMCRRAVLNTGNRARLANVMKKAQNNEAITFSVIGGSITQGTGAQTSQENYAYRTMAWWVKAFPTASPKLNYVNAGIGATGSYIGVHRAERDLLSSNPDVVIVEFSVNDTDPTLNLQSYDSLVRRILELDSQPAVILLFMTQDNGTSLYETHKQIGEAYDLPMISYKNAVMPELKAGTFTWEDISPDNIHPNSNGHGIAAELLWNYFNSVYADLDNIDTSDLDFTAAAISEDRYQHPSIGNSDTLNVTASENFVNSSINQYFPNGWSTESAGSITFQVNSANIGVLYQRTIDGKSGKYEVYVDGELQATLDGDFPDGWGNYAEAAEVYTGEAAAEHEVVIKAAEGNTADGFQLLGLLLS